MWTYCWGKLLNGCLSPMYEGFDVSGISGVHILLFVSNLRLYAAFGSIRFLSNSVHE